MRAGVGAVVVPVILALAAWVAHPDVVSVAQAQFDRVLGSRPNQIERQRDDVHVGVDDLLDVGSTPGAITEHGLRSNLSVGFRYISFWLTGRGAVGLDKLMEDAATAEISRSQVWQWIHHAVQLEDGRTVDRRMVRSLLDEELAKIRADVGESTWAAGRSDETLAVFEQVALGHELPEFLTLVAYPLLDRGEMAR